MTVLVNPFVRQIMHSASRRKSDDLEIHLAYAVGSRRYLFSFPNKVLALG